MSCILLRWTIIEWIYSTLIQRCQLWEIRCGWNANSALVSGPTSWGLGGRSVRTSEKGQGSKTMKAYSIWAVVLYWKILSGDQTHNCSKAFLFNQLTYKSPSYNSTNCIQPPFLISDHCIPSKCSFFQKNVRQSRSACEDLQLPDKEWKGMKMNILASFQSRQKPVGLRRVFTWWIFPNKFFRFSNYVSTQPCH